jgi:hypothetical protein
VKELRLDGVCDMGTGNAFLSEFLERFNEKFSVRAAKPDNLHRRLTVSPDLPPRTALRRSAVDSGVRSQAAHPGSQCPLRGSWRPVCRPLRLCRRTSGGALEGTGASLPKDQRVSHTAIIENKRLGHAMAIIKAQQNLKYVPKVKTNSENGRGDLFRVARASYCAVCVERTEIE